MNVLKSIDLFKQMAEQEEKRRERQQREEFAAADRKRKEEEKAAIVAEKARQIELERQREEAAKKHARQVASKRKNNAGFKAKQREEKKTALAKLAASAPAPAGLHLVAKRIVPKPIAKNEDELVTQIKAVIVRRDSTRAEWIDASVELAGLLCEARSRYPANQKFADWLDKHDIKINPDDRSAMLNLGLDLQAMRVILEQTDRSSYKQIWREVQLQIASK